MRDLEATRPPALASSQDSLCVCSQQNFVIVLATHLLSLCSVMSIACSVCKNFPRIIHWGWVVISQCDVACESCAQQLVHSAAGTGRHGLYAQ